MKLGACLILACASYMNYTVAEQHWGYQGKVSPEHWGEISKDFSQCKAGKHQSPINITNTKKLHNNSLTFHYDIEPEDLVNNGHTIQINVKGDQDYLIYNGNKYFLKQFHFHTSSENLIQGKSFPLEAHFVHADKDGKLLVLAVMAEEGKENPELAKAWAVVTNKKDEPIPLENTFDIDKFLPKNHSYYHFEGSLTTPPCTEGVNWILLKTPVSVSKEQVEKFSTLINDKHNNRPVQSINDRIVDEN